MGHSEGDAFKRRDRLLPRYRWTTSRGGTWFGVIGIVLTVVLFVILGPAPFGVLAHHKVPAAVLLVLGAAAGREAVEIRGPRLNFRLTFDAGILVLALAVFGPLPGTALWLLATIAAEATRDYLSIALGNIGMVVVAGAAAADVLAVLGPGAWTGGPWSAALAGAAVAAAYVVALVTLTELGTWILTTGGDVVSMGFWPKTITIGVGIALGAVSGAFVHSYGATEAAYLLAVPSALVLALAHAIDGRRGVRARHAALVTALTRMASADRLDEIETVVRETAPALTSTSAPAITTETPRRGGRATWFELLPPDATAADGRPLEPYWLRADLRDFELELPAHEVVGLEALAAGARAANERLLERDRIRFVADHDQLTGLLNRNGFWHAILGRPSGAEGSSFLLLDLDGFKAVNDALGHARGDEVLQIVARALVAVVPEDGQVARWGGDEFVVHLPRAMDDLDLEVLGSELIRVVTRSASDLSGGCISASVGYVASDHRHVTDDEFDELDGLELLQRADMSMYAAKRAGKGRVRGLSA